MSLRREANIHKAPPRSWCVVRHGQSHQPSRSGGPRPSLDKVSRPRTGLAGSAPMIRAFTYRSAEHTDGVMCPTCCAGHCIRVILLPALAVYLRLHSRGPRSRTLKSGPLALLNPFLIPSLAAVAGMTGNGAAEAVCLSFSALPERDAGSMKSRDRIKGAQGRVGRRPNDDNSPVSHARCAKLRWPCGPFGARWRAAGRAGSATGDNLHFASTTYKDDDEGHH